MDKPTRLSPRRHVLVLTTVAWLLLSSCVGTRLVCSETTATASRRTALSLLVDVLSGRGGADPRSVAERLSPDQLAEALDQLTEEAAAGRLDPGSLNLPHWLAPEDVRHVIAQAVHFVAPVAVAAPPCPTCRSPEPAEIEALAARAGLLGLPETRRKLLQAGSRPKP